MDPTQHSDTPAPLTLLLPGALAPKAWLAAPGVRERLDALALGGWLAQARPTPPMALADVGGGGPALAQGVADDPTGASSDGDEPVARSLAHERWLDRAFAIEAGSGTDWIAVPVSLGIGLDHLVLSSATPELPAADADALAAAIATMLAEDGIGLRRERVGDGEAWRLRMPAPLRARPSTALAALGHNTDAYLPRGDDARRWRRFVNEVEMAWHASGVNDARQARGLPAVNSLWLSSAEPGAARSTFTALALLDAGSRDLVIRLRAAAALAGVPVEASTGTPATPAVTGTRALVVDARALGPRLAGDLAAWLDALEAIDTDHAPSLAAAGLAVVLTGDRTIRAATPAPAGSGGGWFGRIASGLVGRLRGGRRAPQRSGADALAEPDR